MRSSKAAETDDSGASAGGERGVTPSLDDSSARAFVRMPYEPAAPCASCARGVDPLRAACLSVTESSVHYFCSRGCREAYVTRELEHHQKLTRALEPVPKPTRGDSSLESAKARVDPTPTRSFAYELVAQRVVPAEPSTPLWPLLASAACTLVGVLPVRGLDQLGALALSFVAAAFASRAPLTRTHGSLVNLLTAPAAVLLLASASVLARGTLLGLPLGHVYLGSAALGVLVMWLREHWLEREQAIQLALHHELAARLSPRVRVSSAPPALASTRSATLEPQLSELSLERVRVGDELVIDAGSVVPVDGVVVSGFGELMPYPRARLSVRRQRGQVVLAGALLTQGSLRVRCTQAGKQRALFAVFESQPALKYGVSGGLSLARSAERLDHALQLTLVALILCFVGPHALAAKLAGLGAALLCLPSLALAHGIRAAYLRAIISASARGVLYREPGSIERAGQLDTAVLRVEGPLVTRSYALTEICSLSEAHDADQLLAFALAAGAAQDTHDIARAVREYAEALGIEALPLKRMQYTRGRGVSGLTDGQGGLVFGSRAALLSAGVSVAVADREAQRAEQLGQRVVFLALGGRARGLFVFAQTVQPEARVALQTLFDLGLEVELVSGDHRPTVESIARTLDITQVKAELSAEQRAAEVRRLRDGEAKVVAIGLVPADQSLLAAADLSLSLDAAAPPGEHDVAYDITTSSPDLRDAAAGLSLARRVRLEVRNSAIASALGLAVGLLGAFGTLAPPACLLVALLVDWRCLAKPSSRPARPGRRLSRPEDVATRGS